MNQLGTFIRNVVAVGVLVSLGLLSTPAEAQNICVIRAAPPAPNCDSMGPAGTPFVRGVNCRGMRVDGFPREYIVYVPKNPNFGAEAPRPVVFMFHGSSGDAEKFLNISGWTQKAEQVGLIAVFPTALKAYDLDSGRCTTKWNGFLLPDIIDLTYKPRWGGPNREVIDYPDDAPWPADDISFVRAMLDDVKRGLNIDAQRVYASGFSSGGGFTERVRIELSDLFAAVGIVGVFPVNEDLTIPPEDIPIPTPARHIPVAMVVGECDEGKGLKLGYVFDEENCLAGAGGIPLNPDALFSNPTFADGISRAMEFAGLEPDLYDVQEWPTYFSVNWRTPLPGNPDGNIFRFSILGRVKHQYPRCFPNDCNNPYGRFTAVDRFWDFFTRHDW